MKVDNIYETVWTLLSKEKYDEIIFPDPSTIDTVEILAYLSATFKEYKLITTRRAFVDKAIEVMSERGELVYGMVNGIIPEYPEHHEW